MADCCHVPSTRLGGLYYKAQPLCDEGPPLPPARFLSRFPRPTRVCIAPVPDDSYRPQRKTPLEKPGTIAKLATSRDNALRFFRSVIAAHSESPKSDPVRHINSKTPRPSGGSQRGEVDAMPSVDFLRARNANGGLTSSARPPLQLDATSGSAQSHNAVQNPASASISLSEGKPVASATGIAVTVNLAEPFLFLKGFDHSDASSRSTAMLRGSLHLKVQKSAKIKSVTLKFRGVATTRWPEGIPPKKIEFEEVDTLMSHTWPFFNAQFADIDSGSGADIVRLAGGQTVCSPSSGSPYTSGSNFASSLNLHRDGHRNSLQMSQSFDKETPRAGATVAQKGYRTFHPGDYMYNFELPLDSHLPETIDLDLGSVKYELEAIVERAGAFKANLVGMKEIRLIRAPAEGSLEQVEPIAISRSWEDQLHYDIVISGKSFPLGTKVPVAFKLTPLAKVQCHRIKVYITENTEYFCSAKRVHRIEPTRKVLLFEKRADGPSQSTFLGSSMRVTAGGGVPYDQREAAASGVEVASNDTSNLLGHLEGETNAGPTEMELSVQLPGCQHNVENRANRLHFDTTYQNIQVHHWIKIVLRLSKPDAADPTKRRHFEISIDSPFHILSCRASHANTALPAYSAPGDAAGAAHLAECGCPGARPRRSSSTYVPTLNSLNDPTNTLRPSTSTYTGSSTASGRDTARPPLAYDRLARPQQAHLPGNYTTVSRPIHMLRAPSFNPPAFEDEEPPPPLVTPPPQYGDIASPSHGLEDYFSRFANTYDEDSDREDEVTSPHEGGRVRVPLTPGSRVNRSMDLPRGSWVNVAQ